MHLFVTNREIIEHPDSRETVREDGKETASEYMRFGVYENKTFTLFPDPVLLSEVNYEGLSGKSIQNLKGSVAFFKMLYDQMSDTTSGKNDVLFFVHGFNTDLQGVREAFDILQKLYVEPADSTIGHIVIFT